jgi:hypothetical protein
MGSTGTTPPHRRRGYGNVLAAVVMAFALGAVSTLFVTQYASAQQPPPGMTFTGDAGLIYNIIKPDKTADYEMVMGKLKEALQKTENAQFKEMARSWKIFKLMEPGPNGNTLYLTIVDPAVKGGDYTVSKILADVFPTEVQELYQKYSDAYAGGLSRANLQLIQSFSTGPAAGGANP